jgi:predicted nucleic acid-binding protein
VIVLDASVVVELVLNQPLGLKIERARVESNDSILVPHLLDLEVLSALRSSAVTT